MLTDWLAVLQPEGHLRVLTDSLRAKHAVEWRDGVVEDRRYEYFRGKDFAMYFKQHPEKFSSWIPDKSGGDEDAQIKSITELLVRKGFIRRVDRMYKKPKPGKKRLAKWPKKLVPVRDRELQTFAEDAFYAWMYDRPASPYLWLWSAMIAVAVLAACLFPLAPYKIKIMVVYLSMGLLITLVGAILIRGAVAGVTWMAAGRSFWLLPNVLSEEVGIKEAFWPLYAMGEAEPSTITNIALRVGFALLAAGVSWLLYANAPDKGQAGRARDAFVDFLDRIPDQLSIGGATQANSTRPGTAFDQSRPDLQNAAPRT
ncbi:hypothetical protein ABBQ38_011473 [Trebouxia sp. C0009 RCD-2024]